MRIVSLALLSLTASTSALAQADEYKLSDADHAAIESFRDRVEGHKETQQLVAAKRIFHSSADGSYSPKIIDESAYGALLAGTLSVGWRFFHDSDELGPWQGRVQDLRDCSAQAKMNLSALDRNNGVGCKKFSVVYRARNGELTEVRVIDGLPIPLGPPPVNSRGNS